MNRDRERGGPQETEVDHGWNLQLSKLTGPRRPLDPEAREDLRLKVELQVMRRDGAEPG